MTRCKNPTMYEWSPELEAALAELRGPSRRESPKPAPQTGLLRVSGIAIAAAGTTLGVAYGIEGALVGGLLGAALGFGAHSIAGYVRKRRAEQAALASVAAVAIHRGRI